MKFLKVALASSAVFFGFLILISFGNVDQFIEALRLSFNFSNLGPSIVHLNLEKLLFSAVTPLVGILVLAVILFQTKDHVINVWWKFSLAYLVVAGIYLYVAVWPQSGWLNGGYEGVAIVTYIAVFPLFFALSLLLIAYKSYRLRGK